MGIGARLHPAETMGPGGGVDGRIGGRQNRTGFARRILLLGPEFIDVAEAGQCGGGIPRGPQTETKSATGWISNGLVGSPISAKKMEGGEDLGGRVAGGSAGG